MIHHTPTHVLLTTTLQPLVCQLSGALTRGTRLIDQFVQAEPTPQSTMAFERALSALLREVGRGIMVWTARIASSPKPTMRPRLELHSRAVSIVVAANILMQWPRSSAR